MKWNFILATALFALSTQAFAGLKSDIAKCAAKSDDAGRLDCYDALANQLGVNKPSTTTTNGPGNWKISTDISPIDDSKDVTVAVNADQPVQGQFQQAVMPTLVIRCAQRKTNVYIYWGLYLGLNTTDVLTRLDKERAITTSWDLSTNNEAVFVDGNAVAYAKGLIGHQQFLAQVTPYDANPVMAIFNISGLGQAIKPLREACHW